MSRKKDDRWQAHSDSRDFSNQEYGRNDERTPMPGSSRVVTIDDSHRKRRSPLRDSLEARHGRPIDDDDVNYRGRRSPKRDSLEPRFVKAPLSLNVL